MNFFARIKQNSAVYRNWQSEHRLSGILCGIRFSMYPGFVYESDMLTPDQVSVARDHTAVEMLGVAGGALFSDTPDSHPDTMDVPLMPERVDQDVLDDKANPKAEIIETNAAPLLDPPPIADAVKPQPVQTLTLPPRPAQNKPVPFKSFQQPHKKPYKSYR
jgi:hypothetical protein